MWEPMMAFIVVATIALVLLVFVSRSANKFPDIQQEQVKGFLPKFWEKRRWWVIDPVTREQVPLVEYEGTYRDKQGKCWGIY